jgi:hypothetical protein
MAKPSKPAAPAKTPIDQEAPAPAPAAPQRVSVDTRAWTMILRYLENCPYGQIAPISAAIEQTGGAQPIP